MLQVRCGYFPKIFTPPKYPEKILFCGWHRDINDMIMVLEALLAQGSELWMFNEVPVEERGRYRNAVIRRHLESLPLETFDSILILADESLEDSIVHSDSRSLATLLLIRDIQHVGFSHSSWIRKMQQALDKSIIISEFPDSRTRNLVSVSRISDYVLSNEFVSMALAMVAEDKQIKSEDNKDEIVVGYRLSTADRAVINPQQKLIPHKWFLDDVFVVISGGDQ
ncbi:hypothetical protein C5167_019316 [Papaver somniferum]|uniref:Uncharacterized protein n=1 Tax=Papaver somniferum TaxID=3469 RepID=A0A4Y7ISW7_PAPSO|nr:hypothetical protein C5167_019316 [Papaver somniferum]